MADTLTTKLGAVKPEVGASGDTWGTKQNAAFDIFDAAISGTPATVASATITDLAATTVPTINISGSVAITGFGDAVSGMIRKLIFGAAPLLTNGATLLMPGGVNRQMAAGDTCEVICLGTSIWKVSNIQPNQAVVINPNLIGAVLDFAGAAAPAGWQLCDGRTLSRTTYSALFAIIGTTYGVGDGSTTFNKPDCRGRATFGKGDMGGGGSVSRITVAGSGIDGDVLGASGGAQNVVLSVGQLAGHTHTGPAHTHTFADTATTGNASVNHSHAVDSATAASGAGGDAAVEGNPNGGSIPMSASGSLHTHTVTIGGTTSSSGTGATSSTGSDQAHGNMSPAIIFNKIIYAGV